MKKMKLKSVAAVLFPLFFLAFTSCRDMLHDMKKITAEFRRVDSLSMIDISDVSKSGVSGMQPYRINTYETTYGLWYEILTWAEQNGFSFIKSAQPGNKNVTGESGLYLFLPVTSAHPADIIVWCNALSVKNGLSPVYFEDAECTKPLTDSLKIANENYIKNENGIIYDITTGEHLIEYDFSVRTVYFNNANSGYRLPTKAEWKYAATGAAVGKNTKYAGSNTLEEVASLDYIRQVGTYMANEIGTYDMTGNVCEYTFDSNTWGCYGGHYANDHQYLAINSMNNLYGIISIYPYLFGFRLTQTICK